MVLYSAKTLLTIVRGTDFLQVLERFVQRHHVPILGVHVVEVGLVGLFVTVPHASRGTTSL